MDSKYSTALARLSRAAMDYSQASKGLCETIGMGPALLACLRWEERARVELVAAQQECVQLGILENIP